MNFRHTSGYKYKDQVLSIRIDFQRIFVKVVYQEFSFKYKFDGDQSVSELASERPFLS